MAFVFGDPVTVVDAPCVDVFLYPLPNAQVMVWRQQLCAVPASAVHPWRCAVCQVSRVWWSLTDTPACVRCTPMPPEVLDRVWEAAQDFIELLAEGKTPAAAQRIRAALDDAILSGNLNQVLRLCLLHYWMRRQIQRGRDAADQRERGAR